MRFQKPLCLIAAAGLMTAVAPLASGQLAPPPPPAGDPEPEYVPPARPAPAPAREAQPERPRSSRPTLPELPHAPLWCPFASIPGCVDYDGEVPEYERSIHIMALTRNPATTPSQVADFLGMIAKRRVDLEPRVIENLETLYEVEAGLIDQVSLTDVEGLRMITEQIEPLVAQPYLTQDLRSKGLLSRVQADWNDRLIREYQTKLGEQWQRERPDEANDLILRFIFDDSVAEAKEAYDGMLLEIALRPDEILDELGIPEENDAALRALSADLPSLQNTRVRAELLQNVRLAIRTLAVADVQKILRRVMETRDEGETSLVEPFVVTYEGKRVQPGKPAVRLDQGEVEGFRNQRP